jgi:hypothetical protein
MTGALVEITRHTRARSTRALIRPPVDLLKAWGYFKAVARRPRLMEIYVCEVFRIAATLTQTNYRSNIGLEADRYAITELALTIPSSS